MKNLLHHFLLFCLCFGGFTATIQAQNIVVSAIKNIDNSDKAHGVVGDVIALELKTNSAKDLYNIPIYLYIDNNRSEITSFVQDTLNRRWYFRLDGDKLTKQLRSNFIKTSAVKLGLGTLNKKLTADLSKANFTLERNPVKAQLWGHQMNGTDTIPIEIALNGLLQIQMLDSIAFYQLLDEEETDLAVYLNDISMKKSQFQSINQDEKTLAFTLDEDEVISHFYNPFSSTSSLNVSVGTKTANRYNAEGILEVRFYTLLDRIAGIAIPLIGLWVLFYLSTYTNLIRDRITPSNMKKPPFSFSRTQLAFWTFIIISSFIFIWFTTNELAFFPNSALILLGLSVTVTAAARIIDSDKTAEQLKQQKSLRPQIEGSTKEDDLRTNWKLFFSEILADGGSISIHRLQNLIFNIFLGFVFFRQVWYTLEMPSFSTELLTLMGVSAAAYTGVKAFENKGTPPPPAAPPTEPVDGGDTTTATDAATSETANPAATDTTADSSSTTDSDPPTP